MSEKLRSFGAIDGVEIHRYENATRNLSGIIFEAKGLLMTARHVVAHRSVELPGFIVFPDYDQREVDIAVRIDGFAQGMELGFAKWDALECICVTSRVEEPENLIRVPGRVLPFYEPTLQSEFVPDDPSDYTLFVGGSSGSPIMCQEKIVGLITASNVERGIVTGLCFNLDTLRELLTEQMGLEFVEIKGE